MLRNLSDGFDFICVEKEGRVRKTYQLISLWPSERATMQGGVNLTKRKGLYSWLKKAF